MRRNHFEDSKSLWSVFPTKTEYPHIEETSKKYKSFTLDRLEEEDEIANVFIRRDTTSNLDGRIVYGIGAFFAEIGGFTSSIMGMLSLASLLITSELLKKSILQKIFFSGVKSAKNFALLDRNLHQGAIDSQNIR